MLDKKTSTVIMARRPSKPLTRQEIHDAANARISLITKEFTDGFNFIGQYPKSVTFFGSTRVTENNPYYKHARRLGGRIAEELGYSVFTGGGPGIMEAANRGAFEAGGESLGLTIELPEHQVVNKYLTKHLDLYYFFSRKVCLSFSAEAYIFFPGGLGTCDEFFEILTLVQTKKIEKVPIILVGVEYWKKIDEMMRHEMLSRKMIDEEDLHLYTITDDDNEIVNLIRNAPVRNGIKFEHMVLLKKPTGLALKNCVPCDEDTEPLDKNENAELLKEVHNWKIRYGKILEKTFYFNDYREAVTFFEDVAQIAEDEKHHPDISIHHTRVHISLTTHRIGGLSENDYIMAAKIDGIVRPHLIKKE